MPHVLLVEWLIIALALLQSLLCLLLELVLLVEWTFLESGVYQYILYMVTLLAMNQQHFSYKLSITNGGKIVLEDDFSSRVGFECLWV